MNLEMISTGRQEDLQNQKYFRVLLSAMSHPGRAYLLPMVKSSAPESALIGIACTLMDHEVSFFMVDQDQHEVLCQEIYEATKSPLAPLPVADFIIVAGTRSNGAVTAVNRGDSVYPERGATIIYSIGEISQETDIQPILLKGPGISPDERVEPEFTGLALEEWYCIQKANMDFPLGIDCIMISTDRKVMCIPRSTRIYIK